MENLTPKKAKAVTALLTSWDTSQAAKVAGVTRETIYKWMGEPAFQAALKAGSQAALEDLSRLLVSLGKRAIKALYDALEDPTTTSSAKVRAADIVLGRLLQLRELVDLETRIAELERAVNK